MPLPTETKPTFESYLTQRTHKPLDGIVKILDEKNTPFKKNILFAYNPAFLGANEWNRCVDVYLDKTPYGTMMDVYNIMNTIKEDERPHIETLQQLAVEIVAEMYGVPEEIVMRGHIGNVSGEELGEEGEPEEQGELSAEVKLKLEPYIQRRIILNSLAHGAAVHQWTSAFYMGKDRLDELNPDLIEHYNAYASLVNYFNWQHPMAIMPENIFNMMYNIGGQGQQMQQMIQHLVGGAQQRPGIAQEQQPQRQNNEAEGATQGYNKVDVNEQTIDGHAINFPVLIHELSKGVLEYLLIGGLADLSEEEVEYVYDKSDKYSHEFWHYYMGPTLWRKLLECADMDTSELHTLLTYFAEMDYEDLAKLFIQIAYDSEGEGTKSLNKLKKQIENESE